MKQIPLILILLFFYFLFILWRSRFALSSGSNKDRINRLLRQTARWATAADQDTNPYIANLHATYAMGYLMALREIYSDETINKVSGVDIRQLDTQVNQVMDSSLLKVAKVCPEGNPKNRFLAAIAKEGVL